MMNVIKDIAIQHFQMILICGFTFLAGVGVGAAITDALYKLTQKGEK